MISQTLEHPGAFVQVDSDIPRAAPGELVLKMAAVTVCGSDVRIYTGEKTGSVVWPVTIGHEFTGRIHEIGEGLGDRFQTGELCAIVPWVSCGDCRACRTGSTNLCAALRIFGYQIPGGLSEYIRIPAEAVTGGNVVPLPADLDPALGALAEPLACVLNGHLRSNISVGDSVLILGAGPIGMLHAQLARAAGASQVIVSEPNADRAAAIREFGATHTIDPTQGDAVELVQAITGPDGADVSIICVGIPALVDIATAATRAGGVVNLFAGFGGDGSGTIKLNVPHYRQQQLIGNAGSTVQLYRRAAELISSGAVSVGEMVTHRYPLSRAEEALQFAASGAGTKVAIVPDSAMGPNG